MLSVCRRGIDEDLRVGWPPGVRYQFRLLRVIFELNPRKTRSRASLGIPVYLATVECHSIPSFCRAAELRRSGVQAGVHTTRTEAESTPGSCSMRSFTCWLISSCAGHPGAVSVI